MTEQATKVIVIGAPVQACFDVATDFEHYPEWVGDIKEVTVLGRDADNRATRVRFRTAGFGRSTSYALEYDYSNAPNVLSWVEIEGDLTSKLDGTYEFTAIAEGT